MYMPFLHIFHVQQEKGHHDFAVNLYLNFYCSKQITMFVFHDLICTMTRLSVVSRNRTSRCKRKYTFRITGIPQLFKFCMMYLSSKNNIVIL